MTNWQSSIKLILCCIISLLALPIISCDNDDLPEHIPNDAVTIRSEDFYVCPNSTDLDTFTRGTVFVLRDKDKYYAKITAYVDVDSKDRGGVVFYFPTGWKIIYRDPWYSGTTVLSSGDTYQVHIGSAHYGSGPTLGNFVTELAYTSKEPNQLCAFEILIGVGYKDMDWGPYYHGILHPDHELITIPLLESGDIPTSDFEINLSIDKPPILGEIVQLTCATTLLDRSTQDAEDASIEIEIPDTFELLDGELTWQGDITRGSTATIQVHLKAIKIGEYTVCASVVDPSLECYSSPNDLVEEKNLYLGIFEDRGLISDKPLFERSDNPIGFGIAVQPLSFDIKSLLKLETILSEPSTPDQPIEVTCIVTALADITKLENISIKWDEGLEFLDGTPSWQGPLAQDQQVEISATLQPAGPGCWKLYTEVEGGFNLSYGENESSSFYGPFTYDRFHIYVFDNGDVVIQEL